VTQPGWYADPAAPTVLFRWWDGQNWTDALSESVKAPPPDVAIPIDTAPRRRRRRRRSPARMVVAAAAGFALFLAASAGAASLIWRDPPAPVPNPAPAGSDPSNIGPATNSPAVLPGRLDTRTRVATIGAASITLPDDPYVIYPDPLSVDQVFTQLFWASTTVHPSYDGRRDWAATVFLGQLSNPLDPPDLEAQGRQTMEQLSRTTFDRHSTTLKNVVSSDRSVDGRPGLLFTARVSYSVRHLPSKYDTLQALIVRLDDGSVVVAGASVPNDTDPSTARLAVATLDTLHIG
jgi:Protein of unknown function (DUF2510)